MAWTVSCARVVSSDSFIVRLMPRAAVVARPIVLALIALRPINALISVAPTEIIVGSHRDVPRVLAPFGERDVPEPEQAPAK